MYDCTMRNFLDFIMEHISGVIALVVGLLVAGAILIPSIAWSQSVVVEDVTAKVLTVGEGRSVTYQCGSIKVGDVSVPQYCNRIEYPVEYVVTGTDETFQEDRTSAPNIGSEMAAYKVIDGDSYSYGSMSPKGGGFLVLMILVAIIAAGVLGTIAFMITEHFTY